MHATVTISSSADEVQTYAATISVNDASAQRVQEINVLRDSLEAGQFTALSGGNATGIALRHWSTTVRPPWVRRAEVVSRPRLLLLLRSVCTSSVYSRESFTLHNSRQSGKPRGQPGPSLRKATMSITDDIYRLWSALVPATQMARSAQHEVRTDKSSGKHRAAATQRPYAPVGRTGRRIYRSPSHRA